MVSGLAPILAKIIVLTGTAAGGLQWLSSPRGTNSGSTMAWHELQPTHVVAVRIGGGASGAGRLREQLEWLEDLDAGNHNRSDDDQWIHVDHRCVEHDCVR